MVTRLFSPAVKPDLRQGPVSSRTPQATGGTAGSFIASTLDTAVTCTEQSPQARQDIMRPAFQSPLPAHPTVLRVFRKSIAVWKTTEYTFNFVDNVKGSDYEVCTPTLSFPGISRNFSMLQLYHPLAVSSPSCIISGYIISQFNNSPGISTPSCITPQSYRPGISSPRDIIPQLYHTPAVSPRDITSEGYHPSAVSSARDIIPKLYHPPAVSPRISSPRDIIPQLYHPSGISSPSCIIELLFHVRR